MTLEPLPQYGTVAELKAHSEKLREIQRGLLVEGVDYGTVPGVPKPFLWKAGAEWLLGWARYGYRTERVDLERDPDGRPYGVTYRCEVFAGAPTNVIATCDGYCGYDEPNYEEHLGKNNRSIPRAPWNTIVKMAQKRALVGATVSACRASGILTAEGEDDDGGSTSNAAGGGRGEVDLDRAREELAQLITSLSEGEQAELHGWLEKVGLPTDVGQANANQVAAIRRRISG
jgi:hypothetical protein